VGSSYFERLFRTVIDYSESNLWDNAVQEWVIEDCEEDNSLKESCICGKEKLKYLYTIRNEYNGNTLFPIGSSCIKKFGRDDLNYAISVQEGMFKLLHAIQDQTFINLSSEFFSRKLLQYLYDEGAFDNHFNHFNGENDFDFFTQMFNKRDKDSISSAQHRKIRAIIVSSIKPFLEERLRDRVD